MRYWIFHLNQNVRDVTQRNIHQNWEGWYERWRIYEKTPVKAGDLVLIWVAARSDKAYKIKKDGIYYVGRIFGEPLLKLIRSFSGDYLIRFHYSKWLSWPLFRSSLKLKKILHNTAIYEKPAVSWGIIEINKEQWHQIKELFSARDKNKINKIEKSLLGNQKYGFSMKFPKGQLINLRYNGLEIADEFAMDIIYAIELCDVDWNLVIIALSRFFIESHIVPAVADKNRINFLAEYKKQYGLPSRPDYNPDLSFKLDLLTAKNLVDEEFEKEVWDNIVVKANKILHERNYKIYNAGELKSALEVAIKIYNRAIKSGYQNINP